MSASARINRHQDLEVYQLSFKLAMKVFEFSKQFPREETYSLTDQIRRSSRSVSTNIVEAWRKIRYKAAFVIKLSDAEAEAAETQSWLQFAVACVYLDPEIGEEISEGYNQVIGKLIHMLTHPEHWALPPRN